MDSNATPSNSTTSVKRRKHHISSACNSCKTRKSKCDGFQPQCGSCQALRLECVYDLRSDGRRALPKPLVDALQQRVIALEALLKARGIAFDEGDLLSLIEGDGTGEPEFTAMTRRKSWEWTGRDTGQAGGEEDTGTFGLDRLKLHDGELRQIGPSANYEDIEVGPGFASPRHLIDHMPGPAAVDPAYPNITSAFDATNLEPSLLALLDGSAGPRESWSRNLPYNVGATNAHHDAALELFFVHIARWCCVLDRSRFLTDMASCTSDSNTTWRTAHYSPMLHNAVLALSMGYLDDPTVSSLGVRAAHAERASQFLHAEAERPMVSTVIGLVLLAKYHGSASASELGYLYSGMALRSAQSLGLNIDCSPFVRRGVITSETKKDRDDAFYLCYISEKLWSFHAGRAAVLTMPVHQITIPAIPVISVRDDLSPMHTSQSPGTESVGDNRTWKSTTFRETVKLAYIAERIHKTAYSVHLNVRSAQVNTIVSEINVLLETWLSELPKPLRIIPQLKTPPPSHILMLHLVFQYMVIMLYRPFHSVQPKLEMDNPASRCLKAAARIVQIFDLYETAPGLRFCSDFMLHIAFAAGNIQLNYARLMYAAAETKKVTDARDLIKRCIGQLDAMSRTWPLAAKFGSKLQSGLNQLNRPTAKHEPAGGSFGMPNNGIGAILQNRPELFEELQRLGWTPPVAPTPVAGGFSAGPDTANSSGTFNPFNNVSFTPNPFETQSTQFDTTYNTFNLNTSHDGFANTDELSFEFIASLLQNNS